MESSSCELSALLGPALASGVRAIMVSTLSGSATISGRSAELGNATDTSLLLGLREWADVIVVGAKTVRAEDYSGARPSAARPQPAPIAVVSASLEFDPESKFLTDYDTPPVFLTPSTALASPEGARRAAALQERGFEVVDIGEATPQNVVEESRRRGWRKVSLEGGPGLLGSFIEADAVDQLYLTLDPHLSSRPELPVAAGANEIVHRPMTLENVTADTDGTVFLRYARGGTA